MRRIRCGGFGLGSLATLGVTLAVLCSSLSLFAVASASTSPTSSTSSSSSSTRSDLGRAPHSNCNSKDYYQDNDDCNYGYQDFSNNNNNYNYNYNYNYNNRVPWLAVGSSYSGTTQSSGPGMGTNTNTDEVARYEELPPTVFSPSGRLHPVEAAVRAGKLSSDNNNNNGNGNGNGNPMSNGLVAMRCRDGLVVVTTLALPLPLSLSLSPHAVCVDVVDTNNHNENDEERVTIRGRDADDAEEENGDENGGSGSDSGEEIDNNNTNNNTNNNNELPSLSLPLFLFKENRPTTATGPLWDIGPGMIGATAGNAVDNRILGEKLRDLAAAAAALDGSVWEDDEHEHEHEYKKDSNYSNNNNNEHENENENENDVFPVVASSSGRLARDLANQLQVVTQDLAAAQKQKLGRMLASSAVVLGDGKIWRVDPTGQFWDCGAAVLGSDADRVEEKLCTRLFEECERETKRTQKQTQEERKRKLERDCSVNQPEAEIEMEMEMEMEMDKNNDDDSDDAMDVGRILESLSLDRALELARDVLLRHHAGIHQRLPPLSGNPTLAEAAAAAAAASGGTSERSDSGSSSGAPASLENDNANPAPISQIYWEAAILDYSSPTRRGRPRKLWKRGTFCIPNHNQQKE